MDASPFHADEQAAQILAGGLTPGAGIRPAMTEQHRRFFAALPYVAFAANDPAGWPAATLLAGAPGFVQAPDPATLQITLPPGPADPTIAALTPGHAAGILGIDLATRRRNRANGHLAVLTPAALTIAVHQSFGNCPQYIHRRTAAPAPNTPGPTDWLTTLDAEAHDLITRADTFFVASAARPELGQAGGADISHRGGPSGFVRIAGEALTIPDFHGNRYFNTLGNLLGNPKAALLFVDFASGGLLHLQGSVAIDWTRDPITGAERSWRFATQRAWRRRAAIALHWTALDPPPPPR